MKQFGDNVRQQSGQTDSSPFSHHGKVLRKYLKNSKKAGICVFKKFECPFFCNSICIFYRSTAFCRQFKQFFTVPTLFCELIGAYNLILKFLAESSCIHQKEDIYSPLVGEECLFMTV